MANSYFQFKHFTVNQDRCAMKVTTDACLFGAWVADCISHSGLKNARVLDIGTGTGLLALQVAQRMEVPDIDAIEADESAAVQALENVAGSPWSAGIRVLHGDARIYPFSQTYDIILSNPPFYENELKAMDRRENMARHDESLLLPELLQIIRKQLRPEGRFFLLLPWKRQGSVSQALSSARLSVSRVVKVKPAPDHEFFRILIEGTHTGKEQKESISGELCIRDENEEYSKAFKDLLREYYLYL